MGVTTEKTTNKSMVMWIFSAVILYIILSFIPIVHYVIYPFKLFSTFVHESCHGLASIFTGGSWHKFLIGSDGSGLAYTSGGLRMFIIPAGYIGTALIGGILLLLSSKPGRANAILIVIAIIISAITIIFARNTAAIILGIGFALVIILIAIKTKGFFPAFFLNFLAVSLSLNALLDVRVLFLHTTANMGRNDAVAMNNEVLRIGSVTWAIVYIAISVIITYVCFRRATKKANA